VTIKQLLGLGPDGLEKLTDDELDTYCKPYLLIPPSIPTTSSEQGQLHLVVDCGEEDDGQGDDTQEVKAAKREVNKRRTALKVQNEALAAMAKALAAAATMNSKSPSTHQ
jgi:hypothetical protein